MKDLPGPLAEKLPDWPLVGDAVTAKVVALKALVQSGADFLGYNLVSPEVVDLKGTRKPQSWRVVFKKINSKPTDEFHRWVFVEKQSGKAILSHAK